MKLSHYIRHIPVCFFYVCNATTPIFYTIKIFLTIEGGSILMEGSHSPGGRTVTASRNSSNPASRWSRFMAYTQILLLFKLNEKYALTKKELSVCLLFYLKPQFTPKINLVFNSITSPESLRKTFGFVLKPTLKCIQC